MYVVVCGSETVEVRIRRSLVVLLVCENSGVAFGKIIVGLGLAMERDFLMILDELDNVGMIHSTRLTLGYSID
jgi:hypothetical protein